MTKKNTVINASLTQCRPSIRKPSRDQPNSVSQKPLYVWPA